VERDDCKRRLLDADMTLERLAGEEAELQNLSRQFARSAPRLVASIKSALERNDLNSAFSNAHALKKAVASFEAPQVLNSVLNVERCALNEDATGAAQAFSVAHNLLERFVTEVKALAGLGRLEPQA
jgi:HPt (histidine-containing phosphotransfer) domain-containing protein